MRFSGRDLMESDVIPSAARNLALGWGGSRWARAERGEVPALKTYYVYITASKSRALYTGVTSNLERRVLQHRGKLLPGFTARYNINRLVYYEVSVKSWLPSLVRSR
jgi:hypothetical protein